VRFRLYPTCEQEVLLAEHCAHARASCGWLRAGSHTVQQQALRDFSQAMVNWRAGSHRRPTWRKRGRQEGFRIVGPQALRVELGVGRAGEP
jgi:hypothetical protein